MSGGSWWLTAAQSPDRATFYETAAAELERMRQSAHIVDATQAKNAAERRAYPGQHAHAGVPANGGL